MRGKVDVGVKSLGKSSILKLIMLFLGMFHYKVLLCGEISSTGNLLNLFLLPAYIVS